jgi:hypothetical protein
MDAKEVFETINEAMDFLLSFTLMLFDLKKNIWKVLIMFCYLRKWKEKKVFFLRLVR